VSDYDAYDLAFANEGEPSAPPLGDPWELEIGHMPPHPNVRGWEATPEREAALRRLPYADYLRTDEWQYRRREMVKAAERKCQSCGRPSHLLNVHHLTYERLGNEDPDDLIVLCESCHENRHQLP
jgi:5-methylcytosine-specific restriction endonuclease McrA